MSVRFVTGRLSADPEVQAGRIQITKFTVLENTYGYRGSPRRGEVRALPPTQDDLDRYGRLLRHVIVDDRSIAEEVIAAGMGFEYTYEVPYGGQAAHKAAQDAAVAEGAGLWSACESSPVNAA
ncbi:thermonuclease family protein [Microbacterium arborescens]|uniref:thermonuclease family protein n=1 Tax=Microbacterium arborescens TaxID=33883 RepID=UPI002780F7A9|nr:thermonuclease family protein [Microbacterium arborescens]MDQ1218001.1 hypothetical protein [Microbacterium arborescens]